MLIIINKGEVDLIMKLYLIILLVFLVGCSVQYDPAYQLEAGYVLDAAGVDRKEYISGLESELDSVEDHWAKGDVHLILARLKNDTSHYSSACKEFSRFVPVDREQEALQYETLASLNCWNKKERYMRKAISIWDGLGVSWRSDVLGKVLEGSGFEFDTSVIKPELDLTDADEIVIGSTEITVRLGDKVISQTDRVYRDWLGVQIFQNPFEGEYLKTFSERLTYSDEELQAEIGWHEGGRVTDLKRELGLESSTAVGTLIALNDGKWYATDDEGVFRFEVPLDKVSYPHTRFLSANLGMIIDTHGVNMLVEQAIRKDVDVVLSDCDHEGKVKAAVYLSDRGVDVLCFPDRFVYMALGHDAKLVGSPVWRIEDDKIVYGGSPISLERGEKIVVSDADIGKTYAIWYYTTPMLYFSEVAKTFELEIIHVVMDDFYQSGRLYEKAREEDVRVVATRVFNSHDYEHAKEWLEEDDRRKIILFHSTMYPYAILLMQEFSGRVGFDDPNVIGY